jgi:hypothetical protein
LGEGSDRADVLTLVSISKIAAVDIVKDLVLVYIGESVCARRLLQPGSN